MMRVVSASIHMRIGMGTLGEGGDALACTPPDKDARALAPAVWLLLGETWEVGDVASPSGCSVCVTVVVLSSTKKERKAMQDAKKAAI